ncbi:exodeoxyribonuclease VII large subunit [Chitinophaga skermanii]|uniref:Exodeoxyribonuclease 7 large subunit n=1 Tax=Chitinophaga skermanii TaxID=331697 RepID=A0A327R3U8_9BACT|nr:exodeoxyribonuclease VII large subunit [Chitinophaga skermanii]RAJ10885.1 exodeoxyribonuclease VII large subunit [Chitinophaga skermanii]
MLSAPSIKLSALTARIQQVMKDAFAGQTFWVVADVTNYSFYQQKQYHYFDLVEKEANGGAVVAKVSAVAWGEGALRIQAFEQATGQVFKNDIHVLVKVSVSYHHVYGLQITLLDIDTNFTIGLLEQQKQAVLKKLLEDMPGVIQKVGDRYETLNNRLDLPPVIQRIAVVTSMNSAGYQDFRHTLEHNPFGFTFDIDYHFTVVQGETKAELVLQRLIDIFLSKKPYDAVVMIRGGGAQTDFLLFDTYLLGKAVAKFPLPVITGIGHQKNETVVDMMAHTPTKTPTKAAEFIIAHNRKFEVAVQTLQKNIVVRSQQLFHAHFQALTTLQNSINASAQAIISIHKDAVYDSKQWIVQQSRERLHQQKQQLTQITHDITRSPAQQLLEQKHLLKELQMNMAFKSKTVLQQQQLAVQHYNTVFKLLSPENTLKRGFAIIQKNDQIITGMQQLNEGDTIRIQMQGGKATATITQKQSYDGHQ